MKGYEQISWWLVSLFAEMESRQPDWSYELQVSALEIYNESLRLESSFVGFEIAHLHCSFAEFETT